MREVPVEEAVGLVLGHDVTRIVPGREKSRAFRKGHVIQSEDISRLLDLGKKNIYVWDTVPDMVHEDDAALRLARLAGGPGMAWDEPNQGKITLTAAQDGLLKVRRDLLGKLNTLEGVALATLHNNRLVTKGQVVGGTRVIPLMIHGDILAEAELLAGGEPLLQVKPLQSLWVGLITTGSEVYEGRIRDGFCSVVRQKITPLGGRFLSQVIVPDDAQVIAAEIRGMVGEGAQLVLVTGGMSVDADDVTPAGIRGAGAEVVFYGTPVLPGSMFMLGYLGHVPVCGLPGCVMFNRVTVFDLLLPRVFAGERISRADIAALGHGGICEECEVCRFPACSFGKGV